MARPGPPKGATPPKTPPQGGTQLSFRVDDTLLAAIDAEAARMREASPGAYVSRADAARTLLHLGARARKRP